MTKRMLIDAAHADETRVVLLDRDRVYDYDFVTSAKTQNKGNIYLAKITRVEPSLQAAFVEYGGGKQGFLPFSEIHPDYYQLPADDKAKLLAEQIAEAEAEEKAEEEAFEREQAARDARRRDRHTRGDDTDESDFAAEEEEFQANSELPSSEAVIALGESAADLPAVPALAEIPPVEIPSDFTASSESHPIVTPLSAEEFTTRSEPLPETTTAETTFEDSQALEDSADDTSTEEGEDQRGGRSQRHSRSSFHRRYRIQEVIKRNQIVLVQVIKEERGNKGCSLTTFISLAGRCAVLMPNSPKGGGISRKITDRETRRRLKEIAGEMRTHRGMSVIIRTAGIDRTKAEIRRDYEYLVQLWNSIREQTLASTAPALIYEESNLVKRALRDLYTSDVEEVIIEGEPAFEEAKNFMRMLMPSHAARIKLFKESTPLFAYAGVEDQLAAMTEPQVRLPSGGYLVIHPTEALISIDVNSGRSTTERNVEETAIKTNLEAAVEVGRQLRLRDLAGLIVIDFIDMGYGKNRKTVERALRDALKSDRAKIQLGRISMFGLMELSRQRLRPSIAEAMGVTCPHCRGTGYIHSVETIGIQVIRALEKEAATREYAQLKITTTPEAALYLLNEKRASLQSLEQRFNVQVGVLMDASIITGHFRLVKVTSEGKEILHVTMEESRDRGRGRSSRSRSGRRDGVERSRARGVNFDQAVHDVDPEDLALADAAPAEGDEIIGASSFEDAEGFESRSDRPRRERGGRSGRRGGRNRRDREDSRFQVERDTSAPTEGAHIEATTAATDDATDTRERGERGDRSRRRGRRGGRGRNNRPRREEGSIGNPVRTGGNMEEAPMAYGSTGTSTPASDHEPSPVAALYAPKPSAPEPSRTSSVIPLSEKQTNPNSIASPIISESSGEAKNKRKGWWSRVLEG